MLDWESMGVPSETPYDMESADMGMASDNVLGSKRSVDWIGGHEEENNTFMVPASR